MQFRNDFIYGEHSSERYFNIHDKIRFAIFPISDMKQEPKQIPKVFRMKQGIVLIVFEMQ